MVSSDESYFCAKWVPAMIITMIIHLWNLNTIYHLSKFQLEIGAEAEMPTDLVQSPISSSF